MKHALRCHGFGDAGPRAFKGFEAASLYLVSACQNRASPQGVAATIATHARFIVLGTLLRLAPARLLLGTISQA